MIQAQKRLVHFWLAIVMLILSALVFDKWNVEHWSAIRLPMLFLVLVFAVRQGNKLANFDRAKGRALFLKPYQRFPFLKTCLALYGVSLAIFIDYIFMADSHVLEHAGTFVIVLLIAPFLLPSIVVNEMDKFRALGEQSNPAFQSGQAKSGLPLS